MIEGSAYQYRVRAAGAGGFSDYTDTVSTATLPTAPSSLTVTANTGTTVSLSWTNNSAAATGFLVERSAGGAGFVTAGTTLAGVTTFTDTTSENSNYQYRIRATTSSAASTPSSSASVTTKLVAPTGISATAFATQVLVTWADQSSAETGYRVERSSDGGSSYTTLTTTGASVTSYTDSAATAGTTYTYRVKAVRGATNDSAYNTAAPVTTLPTDTTNLVATAASDTTVNLTWTEATGETGYAVERSTDNSTWTVLNATVVANAGGYADSTATEETTYFYRVRAYNASGASNYATAAPVTTLPAAPTALAAVTTAPDTVNLSWTDHSAAEVGFKVERFNTGSGLWEQVGTTAANVTTSSDAGLTEATAYQYRVRAYSSGRNSTYSGTASVTTLPEAPTALAVSSVTVSAVTIGWVNHSAASTTYVVERSTDGGDTFSAVATTAANATSYTDAGRAEGTVYQYRIRASNGAGGFSFYTDSIAATTLPAAPTGLSATAASSTQVSLAWADHSAGEDGFRIDRRSGGGAFVQIADLGPDTSTYSDTTVASGLAYDYRVHAYNAGGDSAYSNLANVTTP